MSKEAMLTDTTVVAYSVFTLGDIGTVLGIILLIIRIAIGVREFCRGSHRKHTRKGD